MLKSDSETKAISASKTLFSSTKTNTANVTNATYTPSKAFEKRKFCDKIEKKRFVKKIFALCYSCCYFSD